MEALKGLGGNWLRFANSYHLQLSDIMRSVLLMDRIELSHFLGLYISRGILALFPLMLAQADAGAAAVLVDELDAGDL